jgi:hypothetical protein
LTPAHVDRGGAALNVTLRRSRGAGLQPVDELRHAPPRRLVRQPAGSGTHVLTPAHVDRGGAALNVTLRRNRGADLQPVDELRHAPPRRLVRQPAGSGTHVVTSTSR